MVTKKPTNYTVVTSNDCVPTHFQVSFILYLADYKHLKFNGHYVYPNWAYTLGWIMTLSSVLMAPLWAAGLMLCTAGTFRQVSLLCSGETCPVLFLTKWCFYILHFLSSIAFVEPLLPCWGTSLAECNYCWNYCRANNFCRDDVVSEQLSTRAFSSCLQDFISLKRWLVSCAYV